MALFDVAARSLFPFTFSNVRDNSADPIDLTICAEQRKLLGNTRMLPVVLDCDVLKLYRYPRFQHLSITRLKSSSLFRRKKLIVGLTVDVFFCDMSDALELPVGVEISALPILQENHVGAIFKKHLELDFALSLFSLSLFAIVDVLASNQSAQ